MRTATGALEGRPLRAADAYDMCKGNAQVNVVIGHRNDKATTRALLERVARSLRVR